MSPTPAKSLSLGSNAGGIVADSYYGTATVNSSGDITASGAGGLGIESSATNGLGTVNVTAGTIQGGASNGAAVAFNGRDTNVLTNSGTLIGATGGFAVRGTSGLDTVDNSGTITGDVNLYFASKSGEENDFNNLASGVFNSGATVNLGTNSGEQLDQRRHAVSGRRRHRQDHGLDWQLRADIGRHTQGRCGLGGRQRRQDRRLGHGQRRGYGHGQPVELPGGGRPHKTFTIVTATGGLTNTATATDTAAVDFELATPDANTLDLNAKINFNGVQPGGLNSNQTGVGSALNNIVGGGGTLPFIGPLMTVGTQEELGDALDQLAPLGDGASNNSTMSTGATFAQQMLSCRVNGEPEDANRFIREGQCLWARGNVRHLNRDNDSDAVGFDENATFFSSGVQFNIGGDFRFGFAGGFENAELETTTNAKSETERLHLGTIIKYNPGPWLFAGALSGGHGWTDNERHVSFAGFSALATSDTETDFIGGRLTGSYLLDLGHAYAKPQLDLAITHFERDGYTEHATGGIALAVDGSDDTVFSIAPSVEFGSEMAYAGGVVRPFVRAGFTWLDTDEFTTTASFADAGGTPFEITSSIDDFVVDFAAGMDLIGDNGWVLRLQYDGRFGEDTQQHGGTAKLTAPF